MTSLKTILLIGCSMVLFVARAFSDGTHPEGIRLDGTIGNSRAMDIQGPNYEIKAEYGSQSGGNLFHSFERFNVHADETATFTGPNSVENIISRVTGGAASWIDGTLRSTIPGADLYMLNSYGVMFGPHASLDISGSFHVSTADYLRMGSSDRFYSMSADGIGIFMSSPSAYGFLDGENGDITFEGKGEVAFDERYATTGTLTVPKGETLSFVGSNIEISKGNYYRSTDDQGNISSVHLSMISAPQGRIDMVGVASSGEVVMGSSPDVSSFSQLGNVTVSNARMDVSGPGAGNLFVRAGQFTINDGQIHAVTQGNDQAGVVNIEATDIIIKNGASIEAGTSGEGSGADIMLKASGTLTLSGENSDGKISKIVSESGLPQSNAGDAGNIHLEANNIYFRDGAVIFANTRGGGNGGIVTLKAGKSIEISGQSSANGHSSQILMESLSKELSAGNPGDLTIEAANLTLKDDASIHTGSQGGSDGGKITLNADTIALKNACCITSSALSVGNAGDININSNALSIQSTSIFATANTGMGGNIAIKAEHIDKSSDSIIDASSKSGISGAVMIDIQKNVLSETITDTLIFEETNTGMYANQQNMKTEKDERSEEDAKEGGEINPSSSREVHGIMLNDCADRLGKMPSGLVFNCRDGSPESYDDMLPSQPILLKKE